MDNPAPMQYQTEHHKSRFRTLGYNGSIATCSSQIEGDEASMVAIDPEIQKLDVNYIDFINNNSKTTFSRKRTSAKSNLASRIIIPDSRPISAMDNSMNNINLGEQTGKIKIMKKPYL